MALNAALRTGQHDVQTDLLLLGVQLPYSKFMHGLVQENIRVNRKVLLNFF